MEWGGRTVLVTGGASFIGSHLTEALVERGAHVRVVDNFSTGRRSNLGSLPESGSVSVIVGDLLDRRVCDEAVTDCDVVFHLAADHGGRGYVDLHNVECAGNLVLDGNVIAAAAAAGVERLVYASSGCVYPNHLQNDPTEELYLTEDMVGPPYDSDNMYGWAKLMGEMTLRHHAERGTLAGASCRYFTVYGPRGKEDHAVIAMIARAAIGQDPFEVWGTGEQIRNWTYVDDIVSGTICAAEHITDGAAVNLGTEERTRVKDAARMINDALKRDVEFKFLPDKPTGPYNRVASNRLARELLDWSPRVKFADGVLRTIDWYLEDRDMDEVRSKLDSMLTERSHDMSNMAAES